MGGKEGGRGLSYSSFSFLRAFKTLFIKVVLFALLRWCHGCSFAGAMAGSSVPASTMAGLFAGAIANSIDERAAIGEALA